MIITLSGSNEFMIDSELKNIISEFSIKYGNMAIEQIDGTESDLQTINEAISGLSFLSPNRLVVLKNGSNNKQFTESIEKILKTVPDTNDLVIIEPNIDKRLSYFKNLKKLTDFRTYDELDDNQLIRWIVDYVKERKGKISNSDARYLIDLAGNNQLKLSNEIDKLLNYQPEINKESINKLVEPIPQTTIFQLLDAAFSGKSSDILKIYEDQKRQKVEPQQVVAMLTWQIHIVALIKAAGNMSSSEIASKAKLSPFVVSKSMNIARKMTIQQVKELSDNLLDLDIKFKNQTIDTDNALMQLLLTINN